MTRRYLLLIVSILLIFACGLAPEDDTELPDWLDKKIIAIQDSTYFPPIYSVTQYDYKNKQVYLFTDIGNDTYQTLYNRFGLQIGRSGGYGDEQSGVYKDFYLNRTNPVLIWMRDVE